MTQCERPNDDSGACRPGGTGQTADMPTLAQQMSRVERVIGVMSGKGGVGKSLVTGLLASAMQQTGWAVGILDGDLTGPSIPQMLGLRGQAEASEIGLFPMATPTGIRVMSINLLLARPDDPVIWRGPILAGAIGQFWKEVVWGDLELLVVDLPPGTADIPLTVMQSLPLDGLVVVCSPQDLAAMVVRKAIRMAGALEVRVVGLVENMTHLICPHCGERVELFGAGRGPNAAQIAGTPVLASIPVDPVLSELCDRGQLESYPRNPFLGRADALKDVFSQTRRYKVTTKR